ncbi:MAG TPA: acyl carrier protein [Polyangia bacterium]
MTATMTRDEMAAIAGDRDEILSRLRALMQDRFEVEPARVQPETKLVEDLDLDSIDAIDMAVELQGWTGVPLAEEALRAVRTVDDVVSMIATHLSKVASGELKPPAPSPPAGVAGESAPGAGAPVIGSGGGTAGSGAGPGPSSSSG